jgi:hypothetical protein
MEQRLYQVINVDGKKIFTISIPVNLTETDVNQDNWLELKHNLLDNIRDSYELALDSIKRSLTNRPK